MAKYLKARLAAAAVAVAVAGVLASTATLEKVRKNGYFTCGARRGNPGFSDPDNEGDRSGLDVDYCRAVAAAILGDPEAVKFWPLSSAERFTVLQSCEIDLLSRTTTWSMSRDTKLGANFAGVMYCGGQAMMVRKDLGVTSAMELAGASVCTATGTTTELNIADFFRVNNMPYEVVAFEKNDEVTAT